METLNDSVSNLSLCLQEHKEQTTAELAHLQTSLSSTQSYLANQTGELSKLDDLPSKLDILNTILSQHQQETTAELAHLQNSMNSTNSKLDSLMATAANLTHQLETIKDCIKNLVGYSCGGTGGWRRVVYLNMTDPNTTCPSGWNMTGYSKRTCGRNSTGFYTCSSATFPVSGGEYSRVCGRIKAYQWGGTDAFYNYHYREVTTIEGAYACGVSVTHETPRNHIWTFVAGASEDDPTKK